MTVASNLTTQAEAFPHPLTSLIGREREITEVGALLQCDDVRLVTITGPGGVGKTRLAIEIAKDVSGSFPDGSRYVPLVTVTDPGFVLASVAQALGLNESANAPLQDQIRSALQTKRLLLVLDNFEHVADAATELAALLAASAGVIALVTSRTRLRLNGEWEYVLSPLELPDKSDSNSIAEASKSPAVQLFVQRATAATSTFSVSDGNVGAVVGVCRRLDGLPLAIELAAARTRFESPAAVLEQLAVGSPLPASTVRDLPNRHRSMEDAIGWSYDLLSPIEQQAFCRLAVCVGGFTHRAAEAVGCVEGSNSAAEIREIVFSLLEQSLLQSVNSDHQEPRFVMLEPIRDFALERLADSGKLEIAQEAHANYYLTIVERDEPIFGPMNLVRTEEADREAGNLLAALNWCIHHGKTELSLRLGNALVFTYWATRGRSREQQIWLSRVVALPGAGLEALRADAWVRLGWAEMSLDNFDEAATAAKQSLAHARKSENSSAAAWALNLMGWQAATKSDFAQARSILEDALGIARTTSDLTLLSSVLGMLGSTADMAGDDERAVAYYEESLAIMQSLGDPWTSADIQLNLAWALRNQGKTKRSAQLQREALARHWEFGEGVSLAAGLEFAAGDAVAIGKFEQAVRLLGSANRIRERFGSSSVKP